MSYKVLFVCLGNICRSPAAENIMNHLIHDKGLEKQISCDSAGTAGYHVGDSPDPRMLATPKDRGLPTKGSARQFTYQDFLDFDLILAMDRTNYQDILSLDRKGEYKEKVKLMCDFATKHSLQEVPDPYYGGQRGFNTVVDLLFDSCEGLIKYILDAANIS